MQTPFCSCFSCFLHLFGFKLTEESSDHKSLCSNRRFCFRNWETTLWPTAFDGSWFKKRFSAIKMDFQKCYCSSESKWHAFETGKNWHGHAAKTNREQIIKHRLAAEIFAASPNKQILFESHEKEMENSAEAVKLEGKESVSKVKDADILLLGAAAIRDVNNSGIVTCSCTRTAAWSPTEQSHRGSCLPPLETRERSQHQQHPHHLH